MLLSQLIQNSNLILEININNQHLEFKSAVVAKIGDYILIEPVRIKEKVVNFENGSVLIDLLLIRDNKTPIIWKRVLLKNTIHNGKTYYKVVPTGEGFEINRRNAYRMYIGIKGVVQVGTNSVPMDIIIKDVSENGFSFVTQDNVNKSLKTTVRLVFGDCNKTFNLNGLLIRREEINQSKYVYGCILNIRNLFLNQYINEKQREMLSRQSQVSMKQRSSMRGVKIKGKR